MADNTVIPAGSGGDTMATDDIGGVKHQRVKVQHGADGSATDVSAASPLPVDDADTQTKLDTLITELGQKIETGDADIAAIKAAVQILDNAISGSEMQVDVVAALPAGTNNIGDVDVLSLPALPAGANNIGDVDVLTVPADPFGANADAAVAAGAAGSVQAKLRLATTLLDAIKTATETLDNAIAGSEMQVDVVGALPAGANAIGKLAANSGVDIGDVDVASVPADPFGANADAAATAGSTGSIQAKLRLITSQLDAVKTAVETLDNVVAGSEAQVDVITQPARAATTDTIVAKLATDKLHDGVTALTPKFAIIDAATSGDNTLLAAVASKKIRVLSIYLVAAAAVIVRFESGAGGTALSGQMNLAANGGYVLPFSPVGHFETASNTLLNLELSAAVSVDGGFTYVEVS